MTIDKRAFGEELRRLRKGLSMTLKDVVDFLETVGLTYTQQAVSAWERGESAPNAEVVRLLESRFGVDGPLALHLGLTAGDALSQRLAAIEARQDSQEILLREILTRLPEPQPDGAPRRRARR